MATVLSETKAIGTHTFQVVHPLDDVAEQKCSPRGWDGCT